MTQPEDDDHTVIKGATGSLRKAGAGLLGENADALPLGTRLHEFEILSVIGQGGFGIVYLAHDQALDRRVALKEYMPSSMAARAPDMSVAVRSARDKDTYAAGLRSFINEARLLARFDHPALLKVHQFWEGQGTAYMVMPFYAGITFSQQLRQLGHPPGEELLRGLLHPLLDALALMHAANCFHRDIAPDNILILTDRQPLLLDFGAARHVIKDMSQAPTVILKTGYAPVEQYGEMPQMHQGAWTDLYALGSVMQYAITGRTPPQAVARFLDDKREPLARTAAGRYSDEFLRAIDRCLAVLPKDRPQSVAELRALLGEPADAPTAAAVLPAPNAPLPTSPPPAPAPAPIAATVAPAPTRAPTAAPATPAAARPSNQRALLVGAVAGALLLVLAGVAYTLSGRDEQLSNDRLLNVMPLPALPDAAPPPLPRVEPVTMVAPPPLAAPGAAPLDAPSAPSAPPAASPATSLPPPAALPKPAPRQPVPEPAPAPAVTTTIPSKKLRNARCDDIIARVSLGEELTAAEKSILARECKQ